MQLGKNVTNSLQNYYPSLHEWQQMVLSHPSTKHVAPILHSGFDLQKHALQPLIPTQKLEQLQNEFSQRFHVLLEQKETKQLPPLTDKRFSSPEWNADTESAFMAHTYLLATELMENFVNSLESPDAYQERIRFAVMQYLDALAPSNFLAWNPEVHKLWMDSKGESLHRGILNLLADVNKGRMSHSDETFFEVGVNLATTQGSVIYENKLFQLIQYTPSTKKVFKVPMLIVPPCINKFYILDLQAHNSLVKHLVDQGYTVFLMSWRNPLSTDTDGTDKSTWDDYIAYGVLNAIQIVQAVSKQEKIHTLGFCIGGTMLSNALAVLQAQKKAPALSLTLLTSFLDFSDPGVIGVFIDEAHVRTREQQMEGGGLMPAYELANTFAFLRPNDLVWNYVVSNYLKGNQPPPFDILYWNADSTNLPGPFFVWYLKHLYLGNHLKDKNVLTVCGQLIDISALTQPTYLYVSKDDHIVPCSTAFRNQSLLHRAPTTVVVGASGHIAGVVNPPEPVKRHYWVQKESQIHSDLSSWMQTADKVQGSWWPHWFSWLETHDATKVPAPTALGNTEYTPIEDAPGRYVKVRAVK